MIPFQKWMRFWLSFIVGKSISIMSIQMKHLKYMKRNYTTICWMSSTSATGRQRLPAWFRWDPGQQVITVRVFGTCLTFWIGFCADLVFEHLGGIDQHQCFSSHCIISFSVKTMSSIYSSSASQTFAPTKIPAGKASVNYKTNIELHSNSLLDCD